MFKRPLTGKVKGALAQTKSKSSPASGSKKTEQAEIDIISMIQERDFAGAIAVLEFFKGLGKEHPRVRPTLPWLAYCCYHLGEYTKAIEYLEELYSKSKDSYIFLQLACCYYFLGEYEIAYEHVLKGPDCPYQNRILFHIADKLQKEDIVNQCHKKLSDNNIEDQLSLAAMHFSRNQIQPAVNIYKNLLLEDSSFEALHIYVALCYFKLDFFDISLEVLNSYLQKHPNSPTALNLKACNIFKTYSGKKAEAVLQPIVELQQTSHTSENYLIKHNMVVFRNGENALQVLPPLLDVLPEARLNLVIYHLKNGDVDEAYELIKDLEPVKASEYILKGVVNACKGQLHDTREHLKNAEHYFQLVGTSDTECDTIPGRQCMASCFFLTKRFSDVIVYLQSIENFFQNDDDFNWNYGIAHAYVGNYKDAEKILLAVQDESYRRDYVYNSWLARCYIMNGKPELAWELYLKMETSIDAMNLLQLIANDCYKIGSFYYAAKAFDVLERLDSNSEFWEGKRGACIGVFQQIVIGKEPSETLRDIVHMLKNSNREEKNIILQIIAKWAHENNLISN
ncbi:hypothetical protein FDP41_002345 [Naegleria fowleri]|uniref:Intraflagellar transport protein 56 n=1 Tax=Naegleria fowleri TaxID=5763 RepID=A0A6A5BYV8_NAEFO|nr:uncharacterized protein FDP41_002345 [Naegleria fowleri]KAF0978525.1 hypothetical protein FDP41_002345 [Naegleria fowleri]CAG4715005.1 unnamed protein product [Naegleria fowleri]